MAPEAAEKPSIRIRVCLQAYHQSLERGPALATAGTHENHSVNVQAITPTILRERKRLIASTIVKDQPLS